MIHFLIQFRKESETFKRSAIYRHLIRLYPEFHRRCQNKSMERKDGARNPAGSPRTSIRSSLYSSGQREEIVELHTPSESVAVELKNIWTMELVLGVRHGAIVAANVRLNRRFEKIQWKMPLCTSDRSFRRGIFVLLVRNAICQRNNEPEAAVSMDFEKRMEDRNNFIRTGTDLWLLGRLLGARYRTTLYNSRAKVFSDGVCEQEIAY